jgi:predicted DCC family thiol-disulfide oxidoreductase YuxK
MHPVFVFDGDCGFCTSSVRFIERRVPVRATVTPWQRADLASLGVTRAQAEAAVLWIAPGGRVFAGPDALAALLRDGGSAWRPLGVVLGHPPARWLAWPVYRWISHNRYRLPGGTPACAVDTHGN